MLYQVVARRYRPQTFSDVVGQEAILHTLKNAILKNTIAHAYLFSGSRGVGKTTLARLFAKALNCNQIRDQIEPCNQCPSCLDITSGRALDVIEIDGASNRGIDDIRQINETIGFVPTHGKYKIILIDEVHMLTKEAFNALLKTLEEPPEKAKFFFATTEPHKVLPTILSRCQRFDLYRLSIEQIIKKLDAIAKDLQRDCEEEALELIAQAADGSLRDAESIFDQILCFSDGKICAEDVRKVLGLSPQELFFRLDDAFTQSNFNFAFELVDKLHQSGKDLAHFLEQLLEHYRNITICTTRGPHFLTLSKELKTQYQHTTEKYTPSQCLSILDLLLKAESQFSKSISPRITLEMILLQILRIKTKIPVEVLVRRLSDLEESILAHQENSQPIFDIKPKDPAPPNIEEKESLINPPLPENFTTPPQKTNTFEQERNEIPPQTSPIEVIEELLPLRKEILRSGKEPQVASHKWAGSSLDPSLKDHSCAEQSVQEDKTPKSVEIYHPRLETLNLDSARQRQIEVQRSERRSLFPEGKGEEKDLLAHVAASPNSKFQVGDGIDKKPPIDVANKETPQTSPIEEMQKKQPLSKVKQSSLKTEDLSTISLNGEKGQKHQSHYDTLIRFAAIELEGSVKT